MGSSGTLWDTGTLGHWDNGTLGQWDNGTMGQWNRWDSMLLAAFVASGFFFLQFVISKGRWIGGGDIRLGLLMGVILGWPNILVALMLAYVLGAVVGLLLVATRKADMKSAVPFGTFLTVATVVAMFYGNRIVEWYLGWFT